jgi:striatin 1/3/4
LTAIFRPEDGWKDKLRASNEAAEQSRLAAQAGPSSTGDSWARDDDTKEDVDEDDETSVEGEQSEGGKVWKPKRTLRKLVRYLVSTGCMANIVLFSHLDAVRTIAFHPTELALATGGDDTTVKIWRMDVGSLTSAG